MASGFRTCLHVEPAGRVASLLPAFERLRTLPGSWWLDSALPGGRLGRFSFAGADPWALLRARGARVELDVRRAAQPRWPVGRHALGTDPFEALRRVLPVLRPNAADSSIPFVGGAVGYFGYELAGRLEAVPFPAADPTGFPDLAFLLVDAVFALDHDTGELWCCGLGFGDEAKVQAEGRVRVLREWLARPAPARPARGHRAGPLAAGHDAASYAARVRRVKQAIARGDLYQACLTHRLSLAFEGEPSDLYRRLREHNPAPFGAWLDLPEGSVLSSSPERFLRVDALGDVEARPIKGTHAFDPAAGDPDAVAASARRLAGSGKDRAENVMIVDLYRNDLGRVCETGSVRVPELFAIERYATLHQMVSTVTGRLAPGRDRIDLVRAAFPPGSMTGAPKIAAMRLLSALEADRRGVYAGALGHLDVRGGMDLSVVIRTILVSRGRAHVQVGGGIVADSQPHAEYEESMDKAKALLEVLAPAAPRCRAAAIPGSRP